MTFKELTYQIVSCQEHECNNTFRWNGLGIKPKRCFSCENLRKFEKQKQYAKKSREKQLAKLKEKKNRAGNKGRGAETIHSSYPKMNKSKKSPKLSAQSSQLFIKNRSTCIKPNYQNNTPLPKIEKKKSWTELPTNELIQHVQVRIVNPYIRKRDRVNFNNRCISCPDEQAEEAGHYYSIGSCTEMRFLVCNIHGQGHFCNQHKGGDKDYTKGLISRYGQKYVHELFKLHAEIQKSGKKLLRHEIIEIALTYKYLNKKNIWVFEQEEFEKYQKEINERIR